MRKARILITKTKELIVADPVAAVVVAIASACGWDEKVCSSCFHSFFLSLVSSYMISFHPCNARIMNLRDN